MVPSYWRLRYQHQHSRPTTCDRSELRHSPHKGTRVSAPYGKLEILRIGAHVICACLASSGQLGNSCHGPSNALVCHVQFGRVCHSFWVRFASFWHPLPVGQPAHLRYLSCRTCVASPLIFCTATLNMFFGRRCRRSLILRVSIVRLLLSLVHRFM